MSATHSHGVSECLCMDQPECPLTASAKASADAVYALLSANLTDNHLATLQDAGLDIGRVIEHHVRVIAGHGSDS